MNEDLLLIEHAYNRFGALCETRWLTENGKVNYSSTFLEQGFFAGEIPEAIRETLSGFFADNIKKPFSLTDINAAYHGSALNKDIEDLLNRENQYYAPPDKAVAKSMDDFLTSIAPEIEKQMASHFKVINVRSWSVKPGSKQGPNAAHMDGFSRYIRKIMIYLNPPNTENGSIEITTRAGKKTIIIAQKPTYVLLDSAILMHRGIAPTQSTRPAIEVTLAPSETTSTACVFAGQNARFPKQVTTTQEIERDLQASRFIAAKPVTVAMPHSIRTFAHLLKSILKKCTSPNASKPANNYDEATGANKTTNAAGKLNLGGGPNFKHEGWVNLEAAGSPENEFPFLFSPTTCFPVASGSVQFVYSSHCLEHLDDATVARVLSEARRVVSDQGVLLLKLPDFEKTLEAWREKNHAFFAHQWGIEAITHTWKNRNLSDTINARAAMVFCSFWNNAYGDHFSKEIRLADGAYHGPPTQIRDIASDILKMNSPHQISEKLRNLVIAGEKSFNFNHQNSWSREELSSLLQKAGFHVQSFDKTELQKRFADVPKIEEMFDISMYCLAKPI